MTDFLLPTIYQTFSKTSLEKTILIGIKYIVYPETITQRGIACSKIFCYMCDHEAFNTYC